MRTKWFGWAVAVGGAGLVLAINAVPGAATPPLGLTNVPLARGMNQSDGTVPLQEGTDIVMAQITVVPGGSSGWHSHPGGAIIIVKQGDEVTVNRSIGSQCQISKYKAGDAFIERPGEVDDVVNTGQTSYVLLVTFPRVPHGNSARIDEPDPGTCPGL
jgi:quercetin dioxygenase-like cupin family protein